MLIEITSQLLSNGKVHDWAPVVARVCAVRFRTERQVKRRWSALNPKNRDAVEKRRIKIRKRDQLRRELKANKDKFAPLAEDILLKDVSDELAVKMLGRSDSNASGSDYDEVDDVDDIDDIDEVDDDVLDLELDDDAIATVGLMAIDEVMPDQQEDKLPMRIGFHLNVVDDPAHSYTVPVKTVLRVKLHEGPFRSFKFAPPRPPPKPRRNGVSLVNDPLLAPFLNNTKITDFLTCKKAIGPFK